MNAIPKVLAIANPKHVTACVAAAAGVISSKLAINTLDDEIDFEELEEDRDK